MMERSEMAINDITVTFGGDTAAAILATLPSTVTATLNDEEATEVTLDAEWVADENYDKMLLVNMCSLEH